MAGSVISQVEKRTLIHEATEWMLEMALVDVEYVDAEWLQDKINRGADLITELLLLIATPGNAA